MAKIENNEYEASGNIGLVEVTNKYLSLFDEIIKDKQLSIETDFVGDFDAKLHPFLADSLISNLLGNAIKYNYAGGKITIHINNQEYCISNTSHLPPIEQQQLFQRFKTPV